MSLSMPDDAWAAPCRAAAKISKMLWMRPQVPFCLQPRGVWTPANEVSAPVTGIAFTAQARRRVVVAREDQ